MVGSARRVQGELAARVRGHVGFGQPHAHVLAAHVALGLVAEMRVRPDAALADRVDADGGAGIGEVDRKSFVATMSDDDDIADAMQSDARGEILGHFFKADGTSVPNSLSDRAMAPRLADLKAHKIVALAGGTAKTQAIRAILASGLLHGLITDEATARRLVSEKPGREPGKKSGKTATG